MYSRRSLLLRLLRRLLVTALRGRLLIASLRRGRLYDRRRHKRRGRLRLRVLRRSRGRARVCCRSRVRSSGRWGLRCRLRLSRRFRLLARGRRRLLRCRLWILSLRGRRFGFRFSGRLRLCCGVRGGGWRIRSRGRSRWFRFRSGHWSGRVLDASSGDGDIHRG